MAAYLNRLHHISLHVSNVDKVVHELVSRFQFRVFAARLTDRAKQLAVRRGSAVFVVNERARGAQQRLNGHESRVWSPVTGKHHHQHFRYLYGAHAHYPVDTVCNVCFEVSDVESSSRALRDRGCEFLLPPTEVCDDSGVVTYSIVRSVVGNVCHTLVDTSRYQGVFLPGFCPVGTEHSDSDHSCPITHFDHITYACTRRSSPDITRWYEKNFGFQRFFISRNEDVEDGYVLNHDGIGLRLTAMQYWRCRESGVKLHGDEKETDCKFVMAESLPEQGSNQVETFLEEHRGAGIQHIGLYTEDIVSTAGTLSRAGVRFFSPPPTYYTEVGKRQEIMEAGQDPHMLSQYGILLDTDLRTNQSPSQRYLLQVFTKPIFEEDTFFLELIERRGATGFGEGNIRALWRSVQSYMNEEQESGQSDYKNTQNEQHS